MGYAFDVGGTKTDFAVVSNGGEILATARERTPTERWEDFVSLISARMEAADGEFGHRECVGLSVAAVVDPATGVVLSANIPCLSGRRLAVDLEAALGRRVFVANDADCFSVAEATSGAGAGRDVVAGIIIGTGTGGGLVVNGQLVRGHCGMTGEWGHGGRLTDDLIGRGLTPLPCGCGETGCLDPYASARGVERIYNIVTGQEVDCPAVMALWKQGEESAGEAMALYLDLVSAQLALVVGFLDPDIMPVGGGVAQDADLIQALDARVRERVLGQRAEPVLVPGRFVGDGCLRGAVLLSQAG